MSEQISFIKNEPKILKVKYIKDFLEKKGYIKKDKQQERTKKIIAFWKINILRINKIIELFVLLNLVNQILLLSPNSIMFKLEFQNATLKLYKISDENSSNLKNINNLKIHQQNDIFNSYLTSNQDYILFFILIVINIIILLNKNIFLKNDSGIKGKIKKEKLISDKKGIIRLNYNNDSKMKNNSKKNEIDKIKNYTTHYNRIKNRKYLLVINFLTIANLFIQILAINKYTLYKLSKVKLKIKGVGDKEIYNRQIQKKPNIIIINGNQQDKIKTTYYFNQTENYVELIWNDEITNCRRIFINCTNITEFDFSEFDTTNLKDMAFMFQNCSSLTSLNITNFDTSKVTDTGYTFADLPLLTSLDLSHFDTSKVIYMGYMFKNCISLTSLNLSTFITKKAQRLREMFYGCSSLTSLDLSNFDTSEVSLINNMFDGCINLEYINLKNFDGNKLKTYNDIFNKIPENIVICINKNTTDDKILSQIYQKKCNTIDCSDDWKSNQNKIIYENGTCIDNCENEIQNKYEYNGKCFENCSNGYFIDENDNSKKYCKCELDKCLTCPPVALKFKLCTKCNTNYYPMENDNSNMGEYINCYKEIKSYYFDQNDCIFKKCYYTCETCEIKGNNITHNCLSCNSNFSFAVNTTNYTNCYENCSYYYYFDNENYYHCTINSSCPKEFPSLLKDKRKCIKYNIKNVIQNIIKFEKNDTEQTTMEEEIELFKTIIDNIEEGFTSEDYDTSNLDKGEDEIIETKTMTVTFTTTQNQKNNNTNNNMTTIDLGECEELLRKYYNISDNETLYMKKIDIIQKGMKIPKVKYDVYCKLSGTNLVKLNKSICENNKISLSVPVEITESLEKLNSSSDYFNDICYKSTSDSGTDILLKDRQKEFVEGNKTICQEECDFSDYDYDNQKANCSCQIKESLTPYTDINIDKNKLYENFEETNNEKVTSNLGITSCNVLGSKENIVSNVGFFLLIIFLFIFIIVFIIFCSRGYNLLENKLDEVIYKKFKKEKKNKNDIISKIKFPILKKDKNITLINKKTKTKKKNKKNSNMKTDNCLKISLSKNKDKKTNQRKNISSIFQNKINKNKKSENPPLKPDTDYELNWLSYKEAITYDKRSGCEYYGSLIRSKQLFIFTFCSFNDYNSGIIKKFMLFLSFALHYTVNALFFDDKTMHQIYEDKGKFNFDYQIANILFSAIISTFILRLILRFLVLTDKDVLEVKNQNSREEAFNMRKEKLKCMKIKFAIFFALIFVLLGLFWYYLTCFNAIYRNTQTYLIKNTFISFGFSLFYPFIINIFPTMIRMYSIHSSDKNQDYFYKVSQIIQII